MLKNEKPLIGPEQSLPEITIKGIILSIILTIILSASNAYLGLKVGTTIAASIPASIIAMAILRLFRQSNVLESNIVQTAASVAEALVSGIAYVLPALLIIHYWNYFHFWGTLIIALLGGTLGMLFSIPVRRAMLSNPALSFPEGKAIGAVLKASAEDDPELKPLVFGGLVGGLIALFQSGFGVIADSFSYWATKGKIVIGAGLGFSPALFAAGYIIGINSAVSVLAGVFIGWIVGVPVMTLIYGLPDPTSAINSATQLWTLHGRYIGVGTMLVGGIWTIMTLLKPIYDGLKSSLGAMHLGRQAGGLSNIPRTERDIPIHLVALIVGLVAVVLFAILYYVVDAQAFGISAAMHITICLVTVLFVLISGFLFASIAAYFAGLVGSTNSPVSGLVICNLLLFSFIIVLMFGLFGHVDNGKIMLLSALVIMVCAILGCLISIASDSMQDLKAGQIVGSTPWKQQVMLVLGVVVASFVIVPILQLLYNAYGIGGVFPRPGMPQSEMLAAPQATIMAAVVQGVFSHHLPWGPIITGAIIALFSVIIDEFLKRRGMRFPVLALGLGIYLPLDTSMPLVMGGFLNLFIARALKPVRHLTHDEQQLQKIHKRQHRGLLIACGIVAGASLMGVILAIPFTIAGSATALQLISPGFIPVANLLGACSIIAMSIWIYRVVVRS